MCCRHRCCSRQLADSGPGPACPSNVGEARPTTNCCPGRAAALLPSLTHPSCCSVVAVSHSCQQLRARPCAGHILSHRQLAR
jgi:hypothetical protein